jgi:hypothetical protein
MSSLDHTKTPWSPCYHLRSPDHDKSCGCGYRGSIWSGETIVLEMGASPDHDPDGKIMGQMAQADRPTQLADAAFILRAVNSHDALFEALTRLVAEAKLDGLDKRAGWDAWISMADEALSAASVGLARAERAHQDEV